MKSAVETLSPTRAKLTVEVPFEELKPSLDAAYKKIGQQINVPGFRKGKVPPSVIDRQIGRGAALDEAINDALPKLYFEALEANNLQPLAQPEIEVTKFEDGDALEFTAEVDIRPEISLPAYDGVTASVDDAVVADAGSSKSGLTSTSAVNSKPSFSSSLVTSMSGWASGSRELASSASRYFSGRASLMACSRMAPLPT